MCKDFPGHCIALFTEYLRVMYGLRDLYTLSYLILTNLWGEMSTININPRYSDLKNPWCLERLTKLTKVCDMSK